MRSCGEWVGGDNSCGPVSWGSSVRFSPRLRSPPQLYLGAEPAVEAPAVDVLNYRQPSKKKLVPCSGGRLTSSDISDDHSGLGLSC
jgi:hypothetical protein